MPPVWYKIIIVGTTCQENILLVRTTYINVNCSTGRGALNHFMCSSIRSQRKCVMGENDYGD